jgi:putative CRISPR-associated protein (TIGR02620 family)
MYEDKVIVTRHSGLVEWLKRKGIVGPVIAQATPEDVTDKVVFGVLPLNLAAMAFEVVSIDMPGLRLDQRGVDLTPEEMDAAGATMSRYCVSKIDEV